MHKGKRLAGLFGALALALGVAIGSVSIYSSGATVAASDTHPVAATASLIRTGDVATQSNDGTLSDSDVAALSPQEVDGILADGASAVEDAQRQFQDESTPEQYSQAVAAYEAVKTELDHLIETEGIAAVRDQISSSEAGQNLVIAAAASRCITVYKWQLQTIAWIAIGYGALG